ncbi:MAG: HTTM domain-containing protein [Saonia sp.]
MSRIQSYLQQHTQAAPLAVFRILFGVMMLISIFRFWSYGWIDKLYIQPKFFFSYYGFEWIKPLGPYTYFLFVVCALAALLVTLGYRYRISMILFFLSFTYIELMDKTTYLNHYYFISVLSFLMIFLPANVYFSVDAYKNRNKAFQYVPKWTIDSLKLLLGMVYFYAGLAKLNSDWLFKAMPLKIWLPSKFDVPFLGSYLGEEWVHYAFSWGGALYDLTIPFLLLWSRTRWFAFSLVVIFHLLTKALFPIGMFPYIMIFSTLIFFNPKFHDKVISLFSKVIKTDRKHFDTGQIYSPAKGFLPKIKYTLIVLFFAIQLVFPFRYLCYPGELFWTEEGYRFSWRVMLIEKAGYAQFKIVDGKSGKWFYVDNTDFLTTFQEKQMATQSDFILQYAQFLEQHFYGQGHRNIEVYVDSYVTLNGRLSTPFIDPSTDLTKQKESFKHKNWIIPFKDDIKGI